MNDTTQQRVETLEGQLIGGTYRLGALLGEGGYGAVFKAQHTQTGQVCAVKMIHAHLDSEVEDLLGRFRVEARATFKLEHPHTVVTYDFGEDEERGVLFMVLEFLKGHNLGDVLEAQGTFQVRHALDVICQVASSLQLAHDLGVVHRDIKPFNMMLLQSPPAQPYLKVIDFGIARITEETTRSTMERLTASGMMVGTPKFMAPEQIRDERIDGRTDLYALGMCAYELLCGHTPFEGGSSVEIACRQLTDKPMPLSVYAPGLGLGREVDDVLLKAVAKEKSERFTRINDFASALCQALGASLSWDEQGKPIITGGDHDRMIKRWAPNPPDREMSTLMLGPQAVDDMVREDMKYGETEAVSSRELLVSSTAAPQTGPRSQTGTQMMFAMDINAAAAKRTAQTAHQSEEALASTIAEHTPELPSPVQEPIEDPSELALVPEPVTHPVLFEPPSHAVEAPLNARKPVVRDQVSPTQTMETRPAASTPTAHPTAPELSQTALPRDNNKTLKLLAVMFLAATFFGGAIAAALLLKKQQAGPQTPQTLPLTSPKGAAAP